VINTPNSFSIDSRKSKDKIEGFSNNAFNFMAYNVMDNGIRFQGYEGEERHCCKGTNYVLKGDKTKESKYEGLEDNQPDIEVERTSLKAIWSKCIKKWRIRE
jgi:hypothetical protein